MRDGRTATARHHSSGRARRQRLSEYAGELERDAMTERQRSFRLSDGKDPGELTARLLVVLIAFAAFGWIAYVWERATGLTFVMGRHAHLGSISTSAHLESTLHSANMTTLICVPLAIICLIVRARTTR
jgi:hypothetical protein